MKYCLIVLFYILFDLTSGHPLSDSHDNVDISSESLEQIYERFRSLLPLQKSTFGMNLTDGHGYVWNDVNRKPINYEVGVDGDVEQQKKKNTSPIFIDEAQKEQKTPETLKELLNNEQFWNWLSEWVGAYMDLLAEHVTKIIKEEVGKQVQFYFNMLESEMAKKSIDRTKPDQEPIKNQLNNDENKIKIDDREIPLTHTSNIDLKSEINKQIYEEIKSLKRRKEKEDKKQQNDDKHKSLRVEAETVYGNSIGNGKVVNIYVFYPKELNSVLEDIKPITDGVVNGTFTMGPQESIVIDGNQVHINDVDKENNGKEVDIELMEIPENVKDDNNDVITII